MTSSKNQKIKTKVFVVGSTILPYFVFPLAMVLFYFTLCPTVPGGDSGELISTAYNLGVPHPPGYPLYTLLAHLISYLPWGSVAWRINLLSALCATGSGIILYILVVRWQRDRWWAIFAATFFMFSPLAWRYSVVAEVFALNNLLISLLLLWSLLFFQHPRLRWAVAWAATLGLACSHHHTILFLALPLFGFHLYYHSRFILNKKCFFYSLLAFLLGLTPYLYIPWASARHLLISWGEGETWSGFWTHFLRQEYGTFQLASGEFKWQLGSGLKYYALDLASQFLYVGVALGIGGLWFYSRGPGRRDLYGHILFWIWISYLIVFQSLANFNLDNRLFYDVQSRFWLLPNMLLVLLMVGFLQYLNSKHKIFTHKMKVIFCVLCLGAQIGFHYQQEDNSRNTVFFDMGKSLLEGLPRNSLLLLRGDVYINSVRYLQSVEHRRPDVVALPFDLLWWPWMKQLVEAHSSPLKIPGQIYRYKKTRRGEFTMKDLLLAHSDRPIFVGKLMDQEEANIKDKFQLWPMGFLNMVRTVDEPFDFELYRSQTESFSGFQPSSKENRRDKSWEAFVFYNFWDREIEKSKFLFAQASSGRFSSLKASTSSPSVGMEIVSYGASLLERVLREFPEAPVEVYRNLGVAYQQLATQNPQYMIPMAKVWRQYLERHPKNDPQIESIRQSVQRVEQRVPAQQSF